MLLGLAVALAAVLAARLLPRPLLLFFLIVVIIALCLLHRRLRLRRCRLRLRHLADVMSVVIGGRLLALLADRSGAAATGRGRGLERQRVGNVRPRRLTALLRTGDGVRGGCGRGRGGLLMGRRRGHVDDEARRVVLRHQVERVGLLQRGLLSLGQQHLLPLLPMLRTTLHHVLHHHRIRSALQYAWCGGACVSCRARCETQLESRNRNEREDEEGRNAQR